MTPSSPKESALDFLHLVISGKIRQAYATHASPNLRHHNPFFPGDPESLIRAMEDSESQFPHKIFEVQRCVSEGDLVMVHSRLKLDAGLDLATVHCFRFENNKIAEFWDLSQQVPKDSPNQNSMF